MKRWIGALLGLACGACLDSGKEGLLVPLTVRDDPDLPQLALRDGRLVHLQTFGDADDPVVIVLHGGPGGDHRDLLSLEELADEYFVVLWDQRGTGLSERVPDEELNGPTYLDDLDFLADQFSPDVPVHLIGISWGGAYATYYLQNHANRVDRVVLAEPGALNATAARNANTVSLDFFDGELHQYLNTTDYLLPSGDARADYFYVIGLAGTTERDSLLGYDFWRLGFRANYQINAWQGNFDKSYTFDFTEGLEETASEVLFITGEADGRLGHDFQVEYQTPYFPNVEVVHLEDAQHVELLRRPESVLAIREFLGGAP
jgi:proline iminopeptidase